jgi:hypothetical protein
MGVAQSLFSGSIIDTSLDAGLNMYQIRQAETCHHEEMHWTRRGFALDQQSLNIDLVNTIREDLRDMLGQRSGRIDNLMLVNTLLLSFAFDFVTNGTFPPEGDDSPFMILYSILMALSLVFPFWSIFFSLEVKNKLDEFLNRVLKEDQHKRLDLNKWGFYAESFDRYWDAQCEGNYKLAQNFFWVGMLVGMAETAVLMGLYMSVEYPNPYVWRIFVGVVASNVGVATLVLLYRAYQEAANLIKNSSARHRGPNQRPATDSWPNQRQQPPSRQGPHRYSMYPLIHSSHTLLSYTPLIYSSHILLSYSPLIYSSHILLSYTPLIHSSHTVLSYTPLIYSSHTLLSYTPLIHSSHILLSYTPLIHSSHSLLSFTPLIHFSHTLSHTLHTDSLRLTDHL